MTAKRHAQESDLVLIDADLLDVFPDAASVNEALRLPAGVIRVRRRARGRRSA